MKICKDGRVWGQNNRGAGNHLGILLPKRIKKGTASESKAGVKNPMYGKGERFRGEKHWNWKGGKSSRLKLIRGRIEYRLWREAVFARDNWVCQECGEWGGRLNAHHIKSPTKYPELVFALDNGQTLCHKCHKLTDNYRGRCNKR